MDINGLMGGGNENLVQDLRSEYIKNPEKGMELLAKLVSKEKLDDDVMLLLKKIEHLIKEDFLEIIKKTEVSGSAKIHSELLSLFNVLEDIIRFPELENKFTVTVGGQFSSGKSKFLNSILNQKKLLPESTEPTTAIATYILKGSKNGIFALNYHRSKAEIDEKALNAISHEFNKKYKLSFSHILKLITIERENFEYNNLIFLDTPGYSKPDSLGAKQEETDKLIAKKHIKTADYIIWLVDIQTGTIPKNDIEFIKSLSYDEPILFVINKADKKMESDIYKVIEASKADLDKQEIKYIDVVAYSSKSHKEYSKNNTVIKDFLTEIEKGKVSSYIINNFEKIFEEYRNNYETETSALRSIRNVIHKISIKKDDVLTDEEKDRFDNFNKREREKINILKKSKEEIDKIQKDILKVLNEIFKMLNIKILSGEKIRFGDNKKNKKSELIKFKAIIDAKTEKYVEKIADWKNIKGSIKKVSSLGVFIDVPKYKLELYVSKKELKKELNCFRDLLSEGMGVSVQLLDAKNAVVGIVL